jgi:hypothetical protein
MYGPTDTTTVSLLALGRQTDDGCKEACRNIYGIGVILLAITSLAITLLRGRRAWSREYENFEQRN